MASKLIDLWLSEPRLSGGIPSELFRLQSLTAIYFHDTKLEGLIPDELYLSTSLLHILISNCGFSGTISTDVGKMTRLVTFDISNNYFSGTLPTEISDLPELLELKVNGNSGLGGEVPENLCDGLYSASTWERTIVADCATNESTGLPYIPCSCCTRCCDRRTRICKDL
jgi:hypothetical protein